MIKLQLRTFQTWFGSLAITSLNSTAVSEMMQSEYILSARNIYDVCNIVCFQIYIFLNHCHFLNLAPVFSISNATHCGHHFIFYIRYP